MALVNLLNSVPATVRDITERSKAKTEEVIKIAKEYGKDYFDGSRTYGYGGYKYDGRWQSVAKDIVKHFNLKSGDKFLDVGCAKGFLVKDMLALGIDAYGLDISEYAIKNCEPEVIGRLHLGTADSLPFADHSFNAVFSKDTLHDLEKDRCIKAIKEIQRLSPGNGFIQVDSYKTQEEKEVFSRWVLTASTHYFPNEWEDIFKDCGYTGDWYWTIH